MKEEELAEIIGALMGDGCLSENSRYSMFYLGGDISEEREYHDGWITKLLNRLMKDLNKKKVRYKGYPSVGVYGCYMFDRDVVNFFKNQGLKTGSKINQTIPPFILRDKLLIRRFLRGLFDTDGNIYFDKNRSCKNPINNVPIIKLGTTSLSLANEVMNCFRGLGFCPRLKKPYIGKRDKNPIHVIIIYRRLDIKNYISEIGFKNNKHMTKWQVFKKQGYLKSKTTLAQRKQILEKG